MKNLKPVQILLIGSAVILCSTFLILYAFYAYFPFNNFYNYLLISLIISGISFLIFYYLIKYFISEPLKILYKSIRSDKFKTDNKNTFNIHQNIVKNAQEEAELFIIKRNEEINKLKEQEVFRREFLGNLAHELKTPVFSIQGYILTLLDGGLEDENVNRLFLEKASKASDRMVSLIEDLDEITKLEVDRLKIDKRPFNIVAYTHEIIDSLEEIASSKGMTIKFAKNYKPKLVLADKLKIGQVLMNLISNAIRYGNEKGEIIVRFYDLDEIITTEISDNGPGIDEKEIPRLFERFYRVEKSRNRFEGGSGLGLSIVKHIIEAHQQTIKVRSTVGVGSTFSFTLEKAKSNTPLSSRGIPLK